MSKQFQVKRLDSLLAPSACGDIYEMLNFWGIAAGAVSLGLVGYMGLGCYLLGY